MRLISQLEVDHILIVHQMHQLGIYTFVDMVIGEIVATDKVSHKCAEYSWYLQTLVYV